MSKFLIKQNLEGKINLKNKTIIELGAGTGFLSIIIAALGTKNKKKNFNYFLFEKINIIFM